MGRKAVVLSVLLCLLGTVARGQNERFKALFLYNFTRYLEWPTSGQQDDFVILVAGKNAKITNELQQIAAKKTVGTLKMVVRESNDATWWWCRMRTAAFRRGLRLILSRREGKRSLR